MGDYNAASVRNINNLAIKHPSYNIRSNKIRARTHMHVHVHKHKKHGTKLVPPLFLLSHRTKVAVSINATLWKPNKE